MPVSGGSARQSGGETPARERRDTHLVKVDADAADIGGADGRHREEAVAPAAEEGNALVEHKEVGELADHPGRDREELACIDEESSASENERPTANMRGGRTGKVTTALDDPVGRAVEAVVVSRREVDDREAQLVALARLKGALAISVATATSPLRLRLGASRCLLASASEMDASFAGGPCAPDSVDLSPVCPMSSAREYEMPLTLANSFSSILAPSTSCGCGGMPSCLPS